MYRRYYSYNDMPTVVPQKQAEKQDEKEKKSLCIPEKKESKNSLFENGKFLGKLETDDLILLVVVFLLLADDCDDLPLLLALAFIFFNV